MLKNMFLKSTSEDIWNLKTGQFIGTNTKDPSISDLDVFEMAEYIEKCIQFASEKLELSIPPPSKGLHKADLEKYFETQLEEIGI